MALTPRTRGILSALVAAALFGVAAPVAKRLAGNVPHITLSALLYLGAGIGLSIVLRAKRGITREAAIRGADLPRLAIVTVLGGVAAPWLLVTGLARASGSAGALALGLELPFTAILATTFFGDMLGRREWLGLAAIIAAGAILAGVSAAGGAADDAIGVAFIGAACALWAIDSNLTQRLSAKDPTSISRAKCLAAGVASLFIARAAGERLPDDRLLSAGAMLLGFLSYGYSLVLFTSALRDLGAARTGAIFATAPFLGAAASILVLRSFPSPAAWISGAVMAGGLWILLGARHSHDHLHDELAHEHGHVHDEHHQHAHTDADPAGEPHSHAHRHDPLTHAHPHLPDLHHRHRH